MLALECLLYLAQRQPDRFDALRNKKNGTRSQWEYPFAVGGVNLTFMLLGAHMVLCCLSAEMTFLLPLLTVLICCAFTLCWTLLLEVEQARHASDSSAA